MNYLLVKKDGTKIPITAQTWRRVIPRIEFYNVVIKAGRSLEEVVLSVPIDDVMTIQLVEDPVVADVTKEETPST